MTASPQSPAALRAGLIIYALVLFALAAAFFVQVPFVVDLWPFDYTNDMAFTFIASIFAAAAAPILWGALSREYAAFWGVGLDAFVVLAPLAIYGFQLGRPKMQVFGLVAALLALIGLATVLYFRRYSFRDQRPTPRPVRWAFVVFALALLVFGGMMALKNRGILSWPVTTESTVIYGWGFLGALIYFVYGLLKPVWPNAVGQLLGFLAYDLVLIIPFIGHFSRVTPDLLLNHIIYTLVLLVSGTLAIFYLFIHPEYRIWRRP